MLWSITLPAVRYGHRVNNKTEQNKTSNSTKTEEWARVNQMPILIRTHPKKKTSPEEPAWGNIHNSWPVSNQKWQSSVGERVQHNQSHQKQYQLQTCKRGQPVSDLMPVEQSNTRHRLANDGCDTRATPYIALVSAPWSSSPCPQCLPEHREIEANNFVHTT